jgi:S-methylmethionine-dependent homocysteine/selenocysteine methylase
MTDPSLARDRAPDMDDPRMTQRVPVDAELGHKLYEQLNTVKAVIASFPSWSASPARADELFAALTNAQRLAAELVEHTHQYVGLPVPADVAALLGRPASSLSSLAPANAAPHTAAAGMPSAA